MKIQDKKKNVNEQGPRFAQFLHLHSPPTCVILTVTLLFQCSNLSSCEYQWVFKRNSNKAHSKVLSQKHLTPSFLC